MTTLAPDSAARGVHRTRTDVLHPVVQVPTLTAEIVAAYRPRAEALSQRIADRICREVTAFSDPELSVVVVRSIAAAVDLFVDALAGAPARGHVVSDYYRWLGRSEAQAGHDLDAMHAAHHIATQETWAELNVVVAEFDLPSTAHHQLAGAVMEYQQRLHAQAVAGHREGRSTQGDARLKLITALLDGAPIERLRQLATPCWPLPEALAVATTDATDAAIRAVSNLRGAIGTVRQRRVVVVADAKIIEQVGLAIARRTSLPVAVSWGVDPTDAPHALRWATRALRLARQGDIAVPTEHVLRCHDYRFELWQHADPVLSRQLTADVLAPLLAEKPSQCDALGETMLLWLQTRASAPAMAVRLGVHDQTVRNRLRRIRKLFGDAVDQPTRAAELMQALQSLRGTTRG